MQSSFTDLKEINEALSWLNRYWNKPVQPRYYCPMTVDETVSLLDEFQQDASIIAGGVDLIGLMKSKVVSPSVLINIKGVREWNGIHERAEGIDIGCLTTIDDIEHSVLIRSRIPLLSEIAGSVGSPQIRNMGTLGGNLCQDVRCWYYRRPPATGNSFTCRRKKEGHGCFAVNGENENHAIFGEGGCVAVCPSDLAMGLSALGATISTVSPAGERIIPIAAFYTGLGHVLEPSEVITHIRLPDVKTDARQRFIKFRVRKAIDFATVSVTSVLRLAGNTIDEARIILGGVSPVPHEAARAKEILVGEQLTEGVAEEAAKASVRDAMPLAKNGYKVPMVQALVKRALLGC
jgi:xanthine dehydrogenase YagS FAD-binding subunit